MFHTVSALTEFLSAWERVREACCQTGFSVLHLLLKWPGLASSRFPFPHEESLVCLALHSNRGRALKTSLSLSFSLDSFLLSLSHIRVLRDSKVFLPSINLSLPVAPPGSGVCNPLRRGDQIR